MRTKALQLAGRNISNWKVMGVAILLLVPGFPSVLCVAPGGHTAIEPINDLCCASPSAIAQDSNPLVHELALSDDCRNCTDFLYISARGAVLASTAKDRTVPQADECIGNPFPDDPHPSSSRTFLCNGNDKTPIPIASITPLRC
jgi:hypothetical protein